MANFLVEWNKGDEREERVEKALKANPVVRVELVRRLLDEWAKQVLGKNDVERAAKTVAKKDKK